MAQEKLKEQEENERKKKEEREAVVNLIENGIHLEEGGEEKEDEEDTDAANKTVGSIQTLAEVHEPPPGTQVESASLSSEQKENDINDAESTTMKHHRSSDSDFQILPPGYTPVIPYRIDTLKASRSASSLEQMSEEITKEHFEEFSQFTANKIRGTRNQAQKNKGKQSALQKKKKENPEKKQETKDKKRERDNTSPQNEPPKKGGNGNFLGVLRKKKPI